MIISAPSPACRFWFDTVPTVLGAGRAASGSHATKVRSLRFSMLQQASPPDMVYLISAGFPGRVTSHILMSLRAFARANSDERLLKQNQPETGMRSIRS